MKQPLPADMEAGPQPLDAVLREVSVTPHDLVVAAGGGLTHKAVGKACRGRRITNRMQRKILAALQARVPVRAFVLDDLFTYRGR